MDEEGPASQNWKHFSRLKTDRKSIRKRARKIEQVTTRHAHRFLIHRWENVRDVRRFALAWLLLVVVLIGLTGFQTVLFSDMYNRVAASGGGTYAEGVIGPLDSFNPIYASNNAERSASELIFSGLFSYDYFNELRGDLAESWTIKDEGATYVIGLKKTVRWHDGAPFTADDVVYTVNTIKNTQARSPLNASWRGVTVEKIDTHTVEFKLPAPYAPFPHALTFGILPNHLLGQVPPERLRESSFNREPIGTGPFKFRNLQIINADNGRVVLHMSANDGYLRGQPKLDRFQLHVYEGRDEIRQAYLSNEITAAADLSFSDVRSISSERDDTRVSDAGLYDGVYALFKTNSPILKDKKVRAALRLAIDRQEIIDKLDGYARPLEGPLLPDQTEGFEEVVQPAYNRKAAESALDKAGWKKNRDGTRVKDEQVLKLAVASLRTGDYPAAMESIVSQWRAIGVEIETQLVAPDDVQQSVLLPRAYDVLIYELAIGADPDVYAYWHSSQADPRGYNLSNYESDIADDALVSARSRSESELRDAKYEDFIRTWINDVPAVALYQPTLHYVTSSETRALSPKSTIVDPVSRYRNVERWTVERSVRNMTP